VDTIQIDMGQRQSSSIFMNEDERRAAHAGRWGAQTGGNSADQRSFARSQLAEERQGFSSPQSSADGATESIGMER
jgi:hypothetical protein